MKREKDGANRTKQLCCSMNTSVCHISISSDRAVVSPQAIIYRHRLRFIKLLLRELFSPRCTAAVVGCHLVKTDRAQESVSGAERGEQLLRSEVDVRAILANTKMEPKPPPPPPPVKQQEAGRAPKPAASVCSVRRFTQAQRGGVTCRRQVIWRRRSPIAQMETVKREKHQHLCLRVRPTSGR